MGTLPESDLTSRACRLESRSENILDVEDLSELFVQRVVLVDHLEDPASSESMARVGHLVLANGDPTRSSEFHAQRTKHP